jgi:hypothetical protein
MKATGQFIQVICVALAALTLQACDRPVRERKQVQKEEPYKGPWEIEIGRDQDGKFFDCTARNYGDEKGLHLALMPNDVVDVGFINRNWNLPPGDVDVEMTFDLGQKMRIGGQGRGALLAIPIEPGRKFVQMLEKKLLVRVEVVGTENRMQFDLKDIDRVAPTLIQCVDDMMARDAGK